MWNNDMRIEIPQSVLENWKEIVNIAANIIGVPAGLIMRLKDDEIEVFVSSEGKRNPYCQGQSEHLWGSGLYCETVIKTQDKLLVPNALLDANWKANPDIKLHMISYLGFPIFLPDGRPFGTICVLDNKENAYSDTIEKLILKFRDLVQADLEIICMNQVLGDKNRRLTDYLMELQALRGLVPICANCKSIRDAKGKWYPVEHYFIKHPETKFTHGICPECMEKIYPDIDKEENQIGGE